MPAEDSAAGERRAPRSPAESDRSPTVVVGGQAGLSAASHLQRRGFLSALDRQRDDARTAVLRDAEPAAGGAWQHRWESLRTCTVDGVGLPGAPLPPVDPDEPARTAVPRYCAAYERARPAGSTPGGSPTSATSRSSPRPGVR